jgi:hypothetical protein
MMVQGCYKSIARTLHGCVTRVSQACYKSVAKALERCSKGITKVLQGCNKNVPLRRSPNLSFSEANNQAIYTTLMIVVTARITKNLYEHSSSLVLCTIVQCDAVVMLL